jgi:hypothetical protein
MDFALILFALPICIVDIDAFVIPNIYSKILTYATLTHLIIHGVGSWQALVIPISFLLFLVLIRVGMGDIKILALILVTHTNAFNSLIPSVFLLASIHIVALSLLRGQIPLRIPLAPSIFLGFATYLATT